MSMILIRKSLEKHRRVGNVAVTLGCSGRKLVRNSYLLKKGSTSLERAEMCALGGVKKEPGDQRIRLNDIKSL